MTTQEDFMNESQIRKSIEVLHPGGELFECRIISNTSGPALSGYFDSADALIEQLRITGLRNRNVYITINKIKDECGSRMQAGRFIQTKTSTTDSDVEGYNWLFVDLDPVRVTGVSSTNEELQCAKDMASEVYRFMVGLGFEEPVKALSGNGCHLLYRVHLENNEGNRHLVETCLKTLADIFNNDKVDVDTTNYNPARICKLHGTLAQKGANTPQRPHRMSRIFSDRVDAKVSKKECLERLAAQLPQPQPDPQRRYFRDDHNGSDFDLEAFLERNGMTYKKKDGDRATIYALDHCPFDHNHTDGDSKIFHYPNGAIAFKCHHNSCRMKKWQDVRLLYEPDAYDHNEYDERIQQGWEAHNRNRTEPVRTIDIEPPADAGEMFRNAEQIMNDKEPVHEFVKIGFDDIDDKMHGLEKTCVTVVSGLRGCGKSTWLGQIMINAVNEEQTVICYSGEMNNRKYLGWLIRMSAGKNGIEFGGLTHGEDTKEELKPLIARWMGDRFWLYNNKYGNAFDKIATHLEKIIIEKKADLVVIDNLMALDLASLNPRDQYDAQTKFMWRLKHIAEQTNTHIVFVAHPRKASGFLRLQDISGTANIGNIVDNAFIIHRNNHDFERGYEEWFREKPETSLPDFDSATNYIEVAKDRDGDSGLQDAFLPVWYERETKRMKNCIDEFKHYGWMDDKQRGFMNE